MKILFDECVPRPLRKHLGKHECKTVQEMGCVSNGQLLKRATGHFDVVIVSDQNLRYQQNLKNLEIAVLALPTNDIYEVMALVGEIRMALSKIKPGDFLEITRASDSAAWQIIRINP